MKFAYIILHYLTANDTINCIESIKKYSGNVNYKIIVVDNFSNNGSYEILCDKYDYDEYVVLLSNTENLGFARGNNVGYEYAKKQLGARYIIICNNDTLLIQDNFLARLEKIYKEKEFDVLGPMVFSGDGKFTSNPSGDGNITEEKLRRIIKGDQRMIFMSKLKIASYYQYISKIFARFRKFHNYNSDPTDCFKYRYGVKLHGCFLIFSERYINVFDDAFQPQTFLYLEEEILMLRLLKYGMSTVFSPEIKIYHKEDSSSNHIALTANERIKKLTSFHRDSAIIALDLLLEERQDSGYESKKE